MTLLSNFNGDQLARLVEGSELLMWGIEGKYHIINTRHFAIKVDVSEMEDNEDAWELAEYLERLFKAKPEQGKTLVYQYGEVRENTHRAKELLEKFMTNIPSKQGTTTPYVYADKYRRYRWVKFSEFNLFVNDEFISLLYESSEKECYSESPSSPLYLYGGDLMILPVTKLSQITDEGTQEFIDVLELEGVVVS